MITWIVLIIIAFILIGLRAKIKKRGYFWLDKKGNKVTLKKFLGRWKDGIEGISPVQQTKTQLMGMWITITGIVAGIVVNALVRMKNMWWWITIILVGSLIVAGVQMIGTYQKYRVQSEAQKVMDKLNKGKKK